MTASAAFISFLISLFLMMCAAWLIHVKFIDWANPYTRDNTALDELAFRELFVQNFMWSIFTFLLAFGLLIGAVASNQYLSGYWLHLVRTFCKIIFGVYYGIQNF